MTDNQSLTGSILAVRDCGSLFLVFLSTDDERTIPVPMDRRTLGWLLEEEDCRPDDLVRRCIK